MGARFMVIRQMMDAFCCQHLLPVLCSPRAGLCCDFDGTVSPIVHDPAAATIHPAARAALAQLRQLLACVALLSGRQVDDLRARVGLDGIVYIGEHGAEWLTDDTRWVMPEATAASQAIALLANEARERFAALGVLVEAKRFSLSLHYRTTPAPEMVRQQLEDWVNQRVAQAFPSLLTVTRGRMLVEVRPRNEVSKGRAIHDLVRRFSLRSLVFFGDDRTDLDAMHAVRALRTAGQLTGVVIGVTSAEAPAELAEIADLLLPDVDAVAACLTTLAALLAASH